MQHRKLDAELIAKAAQLAADGLPVPSIAAACRGRPSGFRAWLQRAREGTGSAEEVALLDAIQEGQTLAEQSILARITRDFDWRSAAWWLTHHPRHRETWSDRAAERRAVESELVKVARGLERSGLTPDQQRMALLSMQAEGAGVPETLEGADG